MEVRCTGCNKLFRVADEKITGSGIKFTCSRCKQIVKISKEDFEQYKMANEANLLLASAAPKPPKTTAAAAPSPAAQQPAKPAAPVPAAESTQPAVPSYLFEEPSSPPAAPGTMPASNMDDTSMFDLSDPASAAASLSSSVEAQEQEREGDIPNLFGGVTEPAAPAAQVEAKAAPVLELEPAAVVQSIEPKPAPKPQTAAPAAGPKPAAAPKIEPKTAPKPEPKPAPAAAQKVEAKPAPRPAAVAPKTEPKPTPPSKEELKAAMKRTDPEEADSPIEGGSLFVPPDKEASPVFDAASKGGGGFRNKFILIAVIVLAIGGGVFGILTYRDKDTAEAPQNGVVITSPDGLQIINPSAGFDSAKGDLVITGTIQNNTDKPKPGWLVTVEVYDAQNAVIAKARLLNGKQLYTRRDLDILARRGANIETLKAKSTDPAVTIPPRGSLNFEIRILEAPSGVASFNPVLQPYDPIQIYRELAEEQK